MTDDDRSREYTIEKGTREGWKFCDSCQGVKPGWHVHGDPLEEMGRGELLAKLRAVPVPPVGFVRGPVMLPGALEGIGADLRVVLAMMKAARDDEGQLTEATEHLAAIAAHPLFKKKEPTDG